MRLVTDSGYRLRQREIGILAQAIGNAQRAGNEPDPETLEEFTRLKGEMDEFNASFAKALNTFEPGLRRPLSGVMLSICEGDLYAQWLDDLQVLGVIGHERRQELEQL